MTVTQTVYLENFMVQLICSVDESIDIPVFSDVVRSLLEKSTRPLQSLDLEAEDTMSYL